MVGSFHRPRIDMGETGNPSENWRVKSLIYSCIFMRIMLNPKSANRMPIKSTLEHTTKKKTKLALLNRSKFQGSHQKPRRAKRRHLSYLEMVTRHNNIVVVDRVQHNQRQTRNERSRLYWKRGRFELISSQIWTARLTIGSNVRRATAGTWSSTGKQTTRILICESKGRR